jgi:hypothetical protein
MNEFVQAHATYRFVIFDEEEDRPRMLVRFRAFCAFTRGRLSFSLRQIWLFKPSMKLAYTSAAQYAIPKSGSIHAAKVLFKIVGPSAAKEDLDG